jgi:hypothetical protein
MGITGRYQKVTVWDKSKKFFSGKGNSYWGITRRCVQNKSLTFSKGGLF